MKIILKNGTIVTGSEQYPSDLLVEDGKITKIDKDISHPLAKEIDLTGKLVFSGMIDTHVHFRDPGALHKGDIITESMAAVSGGVTSVCDMPNTTPNTTTIDLVHQKQQLFASKSLCNFGIYIGASKNNLEELKRADEERSIPGIKIFMAESTGDMTLAEDRYLEPIFRETSKLIAVHAEDESRRLERVQAFKDGTLEGAEGIAEDDPYQHALIRDNLTAAIGTKHAVELAIKYHHRLHILHISTEEEIPYLMEGIEEGVISGETCPHYLLFDREDIKTKGNFLKMNPALKGKKDQQALFRALSSGVISQITTDHAPHLQEEKERSYFDAPAGIPGVQFVFPLLLDLASRGHLSYQLVARLISENPARNFGITSKGFLKEGYDADMVIIDPNQLSVVSRTDVISKCAWTPYNGMTLGGGSVFQTYVGGNLVFDQGLVVSDSRGKSLKVSENDFVNMENI